MNIKRANAPESELERLTMDRESFLQSIFSAAPLGIGVVIERVLEARIFAVLDVWDTLHSDRPYRQAWKREQVLEYLRAQAGKQFDPTVVAAFLAQVQEFEQMP